MAKFTKTCRVCGKQYEACKTFTQNLGVFRWQDVACSPECGSEYLNRVMEARGLQDTKKRSRRNKVVEVIEAPAPVVETEPVTEEVIALEEFVSEEPVI